MKLRLDIRAGYSGRPLSRGETWYDDRLNLVQDDDETAQDFLDRAVELLSSSVANLADDAEVEDE